MRNTKVAALALSILTGLVGGCHVQQVAVSDSVAVTTNGPNAGTTVNTTTVTITWQHNVQVSGIAPSDFAQFPSSGFVVSDSAPSAVFTANTSTPSSVTLTATTDTGYTSSITVPLQSTNAAINPVNSGDAVNSYALTETSQFDTWAQVVSQNAQSSINLQASAALPYTAVQASGTYTASSQATSTVSSPSSVATTQVTLSAPPPSPCGTAHTHCYNQ